ncbi:DNA-binding protein [Paenibacillus baekrokdamisoli]|uniref:DNA-binding protein n=1 Tax=Paenibacillus baekrokdamisoli TaxID=1712516 RepID=A0A3G9IYJ3_9BACL|nr:GyrI-like domain-containing protein [Paenibacillus baekrokdamisoli]MBB3068764.1 putative transcriptional regulator YdeE [Paenibacillus baekrokdamisoli]BBH23596.1 DNA-binding protein [Paenibacillus baekrokdamisoli]
MNTHIVQKPEITLVGVTVRTTNAEEAGPNRRLPQLWDTYFQSNLALQTDAHNPHLIYGLYTDYESDAAGAYTTLIGHEAGDAMLTGDNNFVHAVIPESKYIVFTTKKGPVYEVVAQAWGEIWGYFKESVETRTYTGDFELYDSRNFDPLSTEVQIYIAIE